MRGIAAVFVCLHHGWLTIWPETEGVSAPGLWHPLTICLRYGHFAVTFFIVLSGYVLALQVVRFDNTLKGGPWEFYKRRAKRIIPPYWCALVLSLIIDHFIRYPSHTIYDTLLPVTNKGIATHALMIHNVWSDTRQNINAPMWSVALEFQIYLTFPLMVWMAKRFGWLKCLGVVSLIAVPIYFAIRHSQYNYLMPMYYVFFAMGAVSVAATNDSTLTRLRDLPWRAVIGVCSIAFLALLWKLGAHIYGAYVVPEVIFAVIAAAMLLVLAKNSGGWFVRALSWKPLRWLGAFSYSLYLIHVPVQQFIWQTICDPLNTTPQVKFLVLEIVGTSIIVGMAFLFHVAFEKPFMSTRQKLAEPKL